MKIVVFAVAISFVSSIAFSGIANADTTVIQGSAQDTIHVSTNIQGSGSVSTHIQSTVNGQTKTFDSNKPGSYTIENTVPGTTNSITATPTLAPSISPSASPTAIPQKHTQQISVFAKVQEAIHHFFQKLLSIFHL